MPVTDLLPAEIFEKFHSSLSLEESNRYCERLAKSHYENFSIATVFLPGDLKQHFYNIYAYCRWSDDLADEISDPGKSLQLLEWWENQLIKTYQGQPEHPVFIALADTIESFQIPMIPFQNLLIAFRQDQIKTRYATFAELLDYCRNSANPVGHLVLYLCGYGDKERQELADFTCTALQLTNFWQDITVDLLKNRIYIPLEDMNKYQYSELDLYARKYNDRFIELMKFEINRTKDYFQNGLNLIDRVHGKIRKDIELFSRGGLEILTKIEKYHFDIFYQRPQLSKWDKLRLIFKHGFSQRMIGR